MAYKYTKTQPLNVTPIWHRQEGELEHMFEAFLMWLEGKSQYEIAEHFDLQQPTIAYIKKRWSWEKRKIAKYNFERTGIDTSIEARKEDAIIQREVGDEEFATEAVKETVSITTVLKQAIGRKARIMKQNLDRALRIEMGEEILDEEEEFHVVSTGELKQLAGALQLVDTMERRAVGLPTNLRAKEVDEPDYENMVFTVGMEDDGNG
jgi:hypothetical protein